MSKSKKRLVPVRRFKEFENADTWEERKFKDILKTHSFRSYLADISENGEYEVIQQGDKPIVGYSDGKPFTNYKDITLFGDHTVSLYKPKRPFFVATDGVKILSADNFEGDYLYTTLERYKPEPQGYKRHFTILKNQDVWFTGNMEEQQKIGTFFKQLDKTIALHQRKLDKLKRVKSAYLAEMFPAEGEREPKRRFPGFTGAWEQRKLGEVATFINGRAYKQNELLDSGKYKVLRVGNFYTNDSWYYSNLELADKYYIDKGDLVYTWSATFGPHIWDGEKVIYHYHIWKIELSESLDRDFTLQILEADKAKLLANTNGSTMIHVTKKDMESKVISLPNIEEQKQIGSYLMKFDSLIALHQRKLDKLKKMKAAYLNEMFV
ncbi:restriction endonuclease subunit S [Limosilactobacillus fermentum]